MSKNQTGGPAAAPVENLAGFADRTGLALWIVEPGGGSFLHVNEHAKQMYPYHDFTGTGFADWQRSGVARGRISNSIAYIDTDQYIHQVRNIFNRTSLIEFAASHADTGSKCHVIHAPGPDGSWIQLRSMDGKVPALDGMHLDDALGCSSLTPRSIGNIIERANCERPLPIEDSLNLLMVATAICTESGKVFTANKLMIRLLEQGDGLRFANGRLVTGDEDMSDTVGRLICGHASMNSMAPPSLLQIPRRNELPFIMSIEHVRRHFTAERWAQPMSIVSIADPDQRPDIDPEWLRSLYGLSMSEAEVALLIASGLSTKEVARSRDVAPGTITNQLSAIYAKTGAASNAKLQQVISNLAKLRPTHQPHPRAEFKVRGYSEGKFDGIGKH